LSSVNEGDQLNSPLSYSKSHLFYYRLTYRAALEYDRNFVKHELGGLAYLFYQYLTKNHTSSPELLPYNRLSSGVELRYGYDNRYFLREIGRASCRERV